jgi:hypothetical protein
MNKNNLFPQNRNDARVFSQISQIHFGVDMISRNIYISRFSMKFYIDLYIKIY